MHEPIPAGDTPRGREWSDLRVVRSSRLGLIHQLQNYDLTLRLLSQSDVHQASRVLDLGAGFGFLGNMIRNAFPQVDITCMDGDPVAQAYARRSYPQLPFAVCDFDATAIPYPHASIDVVIALEMIEHLDDPTRFLREVSRIAKPGSTFLLSTPIQNGGIHDANHHREFSFFELKLLLEQYGFTIERLYGMGFLLGKIRNMVRQTACGGESVSHDHNQFKRKILDLIPDILLDACTKPHQLSPQTGRTALYTNMYIQCRKQNS